jgi:disulfide bond formation protein DsbB
MRSWSKRIAWLCLVLMLSTVYSLAAHHHSNSIDAAKCSICIAARSASPITAGTLLHAAFSPVRIVSIPEPVPAKQRLIAFALSVRPPPGI